MNWKSIAIRGALGGLLGGGTAVAIEAINPLSLPGRYALLMFFGGIVLALALPLGMSPTRRKHEVMHLEAREQAIETREASMLSNEDKARIEAEENYRRSLRGGSEPVQTTSFTDKANKAGFYLWIGMMVLIAVGLTTCAVAFRR